MMETRFDGKASLLVDVLHSYARERRIFPDDQSEVRGNDLSMDAWLARFAARGSQQFGHEDVFQLLLERSPADVKLLVACWAVDEVEVKSLLGANPGLASKLS